MPKILFSFWTLVFTFLCALLYICLLLFLLNYRFIFATTFSPFSLIEKLTLITTLSGGLFTAFSPLDSFFVILTSMLVGMNIVLIVKTLFLLQHFDNVKLSVGGATIVGIISAGCSSCGFSVLSVVGLGSALSFLPFHGLELHVVAIGLLLFSLWYMLKKLRESVYCKR